MSATLLTIWFILTITLVLDSTALRIYPYKMDPRENPDYGRYAVKHPTLDDFDQIPQFASLRTIRVTDKMINYAEDVKKYCLDPNTTLGHVIWPRGPDFMFAENYKDFIDYVKSQGLYITSIHGFAPFNPGYRPPKEVLDYLEEALGARWFGMANGEQDGHYFGAFGIEVIPQNMAPSEQYLNFRAYFKGMEGILGPKMTTLLSSTFSHYQLKTGLYTIAGAETSQTGPNSQLRYSFIRGAGKQYGVLWFGNVSVYNRFGHKVYTENEKKSRKYTKRAKKKTYRSFPPYEDKGREYVCDNNSTLMDPYGPNCGTSLNLMKRLMYAQMMYNSIYVSFEDGWFTDSNQGNTLSPIGLIQHNAYLWSKKIQNLGTNVVTVGLYLDFFSGWTAPRLRTGNIYRMWSHLPYTHADYFTDQVLRMVYPGYQDASYFHDESGISSATPYSDNLDVLLSDAPSWVLQQYDTIIIGGELKTNLLEVAGNLEEYVMNGGNLLMTAGNLMKLPNGIFNITSDIKSCKFVPGGQKYYVPGQRTPYDEYYNMTLCDIQIPSSLDSIMVGFLTADSTPLAWGISFKGGGTVVIFTSIFGLSNDIANPNPVNEVDTTLDAPYPLLSHVEMLLDGTLYFTAMFTCDDCINPLSIVTNYIDKTEYMVLVSNPQLKELHLNLYSPNSYITSMTEIQLDQAEKGKAGYFPDGFEDSDIGKNTNTTIAGGDTRLFRVTVDPSGEGLQFIPKISPKPRPRGVALHLRHIYHSIRYSLLLRPTFFQHFDSVIVDYSYIISKDNNFLSSEREWLQQQAVKVYVDASPSINLFPGIKLTNDTPDLYNKSIQYLTSLIEKMSFLGSHDLVVSLHIFPFGQSNEDSRRDFSTTLQSLMKNATKYNITLHMLDTPKNPLPLMPLSRFLDSNNLTSIKFVLNAAGLVAYGTDYTYDDIITNRSDLLYLNAPGIDQFKSNYTLNAPISKADVTTRKSVAAVMSHVCTLRQCPYKATKKKPKLSVPGNLSSAAYSFAIDATFEDVDDEYREIKWVEMFLLHNTV